jgi:predicted phosphodiesterase
MKSTGTLGSRVLVFGGPYSNLAATQAMKVRADELGISAANTICSGDIVAYCAEPFETLELIRNWGIHVVMGNCEESLAYNEPDCGCGFTEGSSCSALAMAWYRYADKQVTLAQRRWMQSLARSIDIEMAGFQIRLIHGSLSSINEFVFASSDAASRLEQIEQAGVDVVIGGHSGIPFGQKLGDRLWVNAGVIGMPANDGTNHGWYMLIEEQGGSLNFSWHPLEYDFRSSYQSTLAAGMTEYAQALVDGLWPGTDVLSETEISRTGQLLELPALNYSRPSRQAV